MSNSALNWTLTKRMITCGAGHGALFGLLYGILLWAVFAAGALLGVLYWPFNALFVGLFFGLAFFIIMGAVFGALAGTMLATLSGFGVWALTTLVHKLAAPSNYNKTVIATSVLCGGIGVLLICLALGLPAQISYQQPNSAALALGWALGAIIPTVATLLWSWWASKNAVEWISFLRDWKRV